MPSIGSMWRAAMNSALLGYVLLLAGLLLVGTCVTALREWASERPQHMPGVLLATLISALIAAFGGYIVYRVHS